MIAQIVKCDICGKQKGEVNHWWLAIMDNSMYRIHPWNDDVDLTPFKHFCGQACATEALSKWMQEVHAPQKTN